MPTKSQPGSERFRDERRPGGPRMHGGRWHDPDAFEQRPIVDPETATAPDALTEAESSGDRAGMRSGRGRPARKTKGRTRQLQTPSRAKGHKGESRR